MVGVEGEHGALADSERTTSQRDGRVWVGRRTERGVKGAMGELRRAGTASEAKPGGGAVVAHAAEAAAPGASVLRKQCDVACSVCAASCTALQRLRDTRSLTRDVRRQGTYLRAHWHSNPPRQCRRSRHGAHRR